MYLRDSRDPTKQTAAAEWMGHLWSTRTGRVSDQVLHEYYVTVTGKLRPGLSIAEAREDVLALRAWQPGPSRSLIEASWDEQDRWGFSFRDSMIVAAARAIRCPALLTEDLTDGQDLDGIEVVSPFTRLPADI